MTKVISISAMVLFVAAGATTVAQSKPDFAGTWTLVLDPNAPAYGGRGGSLVAAPLALGREFSVMQDQKTLTVVTNTQRGEVRTLYSLDGSATKDPLRAEVLKQNVERMSKVKWDGAKLVITTTTHFRPHPSFGDSWLPSCPSPSVYSEMSGGVIRVSTLKSRQTWTLDRFGSLIVESTSAIDCDPTTTKATYKKG